MKLNYFSSRSAAGQPFVVFPIILAVDNSAHEFVVLSVFVRHLTNDLIPRSPVYTVFHDS
jgi:hypothetical protein